MLLVSIRLWVGSVDVRWLGAFFGALAGAAVTSLVALAQIGASTRSTLDIGLTAVVMAMPLGWLFARRAVRPGAWSAWRTALEMTVIAVALGAAVIGLPMVAHAQLLDASEAVLFLGLVVVFGLFLYGLPVGCLTFVAALMWVAALRLVPRVEAPSAPGEAILRAAPSDDIGGHLRMGERPVMAPFGASYDQMRLGDRDPRRPRRRAK